MGGIGRALSGAVDIAGAVNESLNTFDNMKTQALQRANYEAEMRRNQVKAQRDEEEYRRMNSPMDFDNLVATNMPGITPGQKEAIFRFAKANGYIDESAGVPSIKMLHVKEMMDSVNKNPQYGINLANIGIKETKAKIMELEAAANSGQVKEKDMPAFQAQLKSQRERLDGLLGNHALLTEHQTKALREKQDFDMLQQDQEEAMRIMSNPDMDNMARLEALSRNPRLSTKARMLAIKDLEELKLKQGKRETAGLTKYEQWLEANGLTDSPKNMAKFRQFSLADHKPEGSGSKKEDWERTDKIMSRIASVDKALTGLSKGKPMEIPENTPEAERALYEMMNKGVADPKVAETTRKTLQARKDHLMKQLSPEERGLLTSPTEAAPAPEAKPSAPVVPKPGEVRQGYKFKGGNPADKNNWVKVG